MTTAEKLVKIAENEAAIREANEKLDLRLKGNKVDAKSWYDEFWDMFQNNGTRGDYGSAFVNWSAEYIRPKYKVVPTHEHGVLRIFAVCKKLKKVESAYFDLSQKPQNLTSTNNNMGYYYTFNGCSVLEEIEDIGMIAQNHYNYAFSYCYALHTIAKMGVDANTKFSSTFTDCRELVNLAIDGTIGQNGFDIHWSTKLSAKSLKSIIDALSTTKTGLTVTLPSTAEANYNANPPEGAPATWLELVGDGTEEHPGIRPNWTIAYA